MAKIVSVTVSAIQQAYWAHLMDAVVQELEHTLFMLDTPKHIWPLDFVPERFMIASARHFLVLKMLRV